jgi:Tol biopolymer transport system component
MRRAMRSSILGAAVFLLVGGGFDQSPSAIGTVINGPIVFSIGTNQLWSINPDGTDLKVLTTVPSPSPLSLALWPSFSADGAKLGVVLQELDAPCPSEIIGWCWSLVLMNADGSRQKTVFKHQYLAPKVALSPDGGDVAGAIGMFTEHGSSQQILVISGGRRKFLQVVTPFDPPVGESWPAWSPDGKRIAFFSDRGPKPPLASWSLMEVDLDTSAVRRIMPVADAGNDLYPAFSPDGNKLTFVRTLAADSVIFSVNADGTDQQQLVREPVQLDAPTFSPDGSLIAYVRHGREIWIANADGSNRRFLTSSSRILGFSWRAVQMP